MIVLLVLDEGAAVSPALAASEYVKSWKELAGENAEANAAELSRQIFETTNADVFGSNHWVI